MQVWMHEIQPKLARLSSRGRQIIVDKSGPQIPQEPPEAVIAAVAEIVHSVHDESPVFQPPLQELVEFAFLIW